jgi:hypothetical protein
MPTPSSLQDTALEHLRVIRTLMERAHIYRTVSIPAALIGGVLSLAVAIYGFKAGNPPEGPSSFGSHVFLGAWLGVLLVTSVINFFLLMRESGAKGEPMITEGMRMALRALVPPMLTGGVLGCCLIWFNEDVALGAIVWILCYGLALQAMVSFAPRSLVWLARAFLVTGQILVILYFIKGRLPMFPHKEAPASLFLGLTFGVYHLVYAAAAFASKSKTRSIPDDAIAES